LSSFEVILLLVYGPGPAKKLSLPPKILEETAVFPFLCGWLALAVQSQAQRRYSLSPSESSLPAALSTSLRWTIEEDREGEDSDLTSVHESSHVFKSRKRRRV
jgi:hypothetical protein